jgi:hypothetical protein
MSRDFVNFLILKLENIVIHKFDEFFMQFVIVIRIIKNMQYDKLYRGFHNEIFIDFYTASEVQLKSKILYIYKLYQ